MINTSKAWICQ